MLHCALLRLSRSNKEKEMLTQTHETHWKAMAHAMASLKRKRLVRVWRLPFNLANPNPRAPAAQEQSKANACSARSRRFITVYVYVPYTGSRHLIVAPKQLASTLIS